MTGLLISDFNTGNLLAVLNSEKSWPSIQFRAAPFGPTGIVLTNPNDSTWDPAPDCVLIWTRPETTIPAFQDFLESHEVDESTILSDVDAFADSVLGAANRARLICVVSWDLPPHHPGHGLLDLDKHVGPSRMLMRMNLRLMERLDAAANVYVLHSHKWFQLAGEQAFSPRLWYLGKIPFSNSVFKAAGADLKAALRAAWGRSRKLLILDLDETLWGGIVGDVGWQNLKLGGHDPVGEALVDFQRQVKALARRGIILAIVSKNDEAVAISAMTDHPEMVLRPSDFAAWRINWMDKAQNVSDLLVQLNLGAEATVFIDDNPVERARVRESVPGIMVPEWPQDKRLYPSALLALDCFDKSVVTQEDRDRGKLYALDQQRAALKTQVSSLEDWLRSLEMTVVAEPLGAANQARAVQLLNKTNQMNLSTRRLTETELCEWAAQLGHTLWTFRVKDRFGDSGLTGIISFALNNGEAWLVDYVLSCRVMGRLVEETMLHVAAVSAREQGATRLVATYRATPRNRPCLEFFRRSGLLESPEGFVWPLAKEYPLSPVLHLVVPGSFRSSPAVPLDAQP